MMKTFERSGVRKFEGTRARIRDREVGNIRTPEHPNCRTHLGEEAT
jgi:hypothetical protein